MFSVEMLPAGHGDSLLIAYGDEQQPHYVLIDGGPTYSYRDAQHPQAMTINKRARQLVDAGSALELLVVTHIDADHIEGIVRLLGENHGRLKIDEVWFNAWRHLKPNPADILGPVQGEMLSALIEQLGEPVWNKQFGGHAVVAAENAAVGGAGPSAPGQNIPNRGGDARASIPYKPTVTLPGGLRLTILSPTPETLADLEPEWAATLRKEGLDPDAPDEALERFNKSRLRPTDLLGDETLDVESLAATDFEADDGLPNGSSIAFIAEFEGKRCLFGADAHAPVLEASIRKWLRQNGQLRLRLDAFKIPHHGSQHNLSADLLDLIDCRQYLVSTNGNIFHHPDRESIARILAHGGEQPALHFNYRTAYNQVWDDAALQQAYHYQATYGDEEHGLLLALS